MATQNSFGTRRTLTENSAIFHLEALEQKGFGNIHRLPYSIRVLLECLLRNEDGLVVTADHVSKLANWQANAVSATEIPFLPARVILQDFTGVPAVVDLAALRAAAVRLGGNPNDVNPIIPVDLVIDHSVQIDRFGSRQSLKFNAEKEFERNRERYEFLRWATGTFKNFRAVPPATGIIHQVNLEYLASVVQVRDDERGNPIVFPDSLVGTDSHTPMINGLGVLGWGVGGIEAEANMLGQPIYMLMPEVVGFRLTGQLQEGVTATDLVLTVVQMLRKHGVVGKFVEFYGPALHTLSLPDRATLANMAPEYGATIGISPVDQVTLNYLRDTGRPAELVTLVERYYKAQGMFHTAESPEPDFSARLELDLGSVEPSVAGPNRPQDRILLKEMKLSWQSILEQPREKRGFALTDETKKTTVPVLLNGQAFNMSHGAVVIASITSCTNTSNPSVMLAAGLLAKKAIQAGLKSKPWVKTSLAPGSQVVTKYLDAAGLTPFLEGLGFHTVGYGCMTCIGNSGPLPEKIAKAITDNKLVAASVLSGNRNFEGRISPLVQASFLASPPLVVAYAIAGTVNIDIMNDPIGVDPNGQPVYLNDIWPTHEEIQDAVRTSLSSDMFREQYGNVFDGNDAWNNIPVPEGNVYQWDDNSSYIQEPPFFKDISLHVPPITEIRNAMALAWMPDSTTTDHISPAGNIAPTSPAGKYLISRGIRPDEFNSYGSRRGNHEVMMRGTLANIRIKNRLVPGVEGGFTVYHPTGEQLPIWDAAVKYMEADTPLIILAGKEYGSGSSRDWAAKGVFLQGVKAVLAESYERIHRSNLVGMGILPLQFLEGDSVESLGLEGNERFDIIGLNNDLQPGAEIKVSAASDNMVTEFKVLCRIDTPVEIIYYRNGGILNTVLRQMIQRSK
ncbi:aconitate hydratase AcnA [candidate division KSB1 bacterium]|nr:aconitate hydratase AcnA [candidate division KSB1 bacterium]